MSSNLIEHNIVLHEPRLERTRYPTGVHGWTKGLVRAFSVMTFCGFLQAQSPQSGIDRVAFSGSITTIANEASKAAISIPALVVRNQLTQAEFQTTLGFSVALKMRNFADLQERIGNSEIISPDEMAAKYYPTPADYKIVVDWLISQGFIVKPADKYNLSVFASGSVAQIRASLRNKVRSGQFRGRRIQLCVDRAEFAGGDCRTGAWESTDCNLTCTQDLILKFASGRPQKLTNNQPPYTVREIANAYNAGGLGVNGTGQKIAIVIDTFPASSDLTLFWQGNAIAQSLNNIEEVQVVAGTLPSPSGEETLDVEWSSGMAPGAKVRVYATTDLGFVHLDQAYQAIINDLPSQPALHQVSLSYGLGETYESVKPRCKPTRSTSRVWPAAVSLFSFLPATAAPALD